MPKDHHHQPVRSDRRLITFSALSMLGLATVPAWAQRYPVTSDQKSSARQAAQNGVPEGELAADAPNT